MPLLMRTCVLVITLLWSSETLGQVGYLSDGNLGMGVSFFTQQHNFEGEGIDGWVRTRGAEFIALPSSRFAVGLGFGSTTYSRDQFENGYTLALGFRYFNSRQGLDSPFTLGTGITVARGSVSGFKATTLTLGTEASHAIELGNAPLSVVPALNADIGLLFVGGRQVTSTIFTLGLGLLGRIFDQSALYAEPAYSVALEGSERIGFVRLTFGVVSAF